MNKKRKKLVNFTLPQNLAMLTLKNGQDQIIGDEGELPGKEMQ